MGRCISCGSTFDGYFAVTCPACEAAEKRLEQQTEALEGAIERAEEETREANRREQEENRLAIEEATAEMEEAAAETRAEVAEAAERVERAIAERPKREANWMADRALELYKVGMLSEALTKAQQAINIDGGNIKAYWVAAQALEKQGREQEAVAYHRKNIMLLGIPEHRDRPRRFLKVLQSLPKENSSLLEQFSEKVFENAACWTVADRLETLRQVIDSAVLSNAEQVTALIFSKANPGERPQLLLAVLRHLPNETAAWLDQFSRRVFTSASSWTTQDCLDVIDRLIDLGRLSDAQHLMQLAFFKADVNDQPRVFLTALRRLPKERTPWLDQFEERALARARLWAPHDRLELVKQFIDSGRLNDAKRLTELIIPEADSLELEALVMEINDRLGVPSTESLRAYLKKVRFDARSKILGAFLRIADSSGRFSPSVINLLKAEISRRYLQWKPEIDEHFRTEEVTSKNALSDDIIMQYCQAHLLMKPRSLGIVIWLVSWLGVFVGFVVGLNLQAGPNLAQFDFICFFGGIVLGWFAAAIRKDNLASKIARGKVDPLRRVERESWTPVIGSAIGAP